MTTSTTESHLRTATGTGIVVSGLTKHFGAIKAVRGIDFTIGAGETVALLGPNGAGKSTTIDMLLGLTKPDGGEVAIFGRSPKEAVDQGAVGAMLQTGTLVHYLKVRELLDCVGSLYPNPLTVDEAIALAGLEEIAGQRTDKLSGGQTQRVRFAVALISNAQLLVLDEPTVALDVEARREFWQSMRRVTESGKTVVFATHYLEEADEFADRIILMARGRIVADGPTTEIKARVGLKTLTATLPAVSTDQLAALPGVSSVERRGEVVQLSCSDGDAAIRAFVQNYPQASGIELRGAGLEEAFLELTSDDYAGELD